MALPREIAEGALNLRQMNEISRDQEDAIKNTTTHYIGDSETKNTMQVSISQELGSLDGMKSPLNSVDDRVTDSECLESV